MPQETLLLPPPPPHDVMLAEVARLGIQPEVVTPDQPVTIGADQPDLIDTGVSPYGAGTKVRGVIETGGESYDVVDIRGVTPMKQLGGAGRTVRDIHGVKIADPTVTHLLAGKGFGDPDSDLRGYKGLRPGVPFATGRRNPSVERRFGAVSTTSYDHGEVSVDKAGNVTVKDYGSMNGTRVTAQKAPASQPEGKVDPVNAQAARLAREQATGGHGGVVGRVGRALLGQRAGVIRVDAYGRASRVRR